MPLREETGRRLATHLPAPNPPHLVTHAANPTHPVPRYALSLPPRLRLPTPFIGSSLRSSSLHFPFRLFGPVAGTETGDDDDERSRSGRRPVRSPLTHFFPHPPRGPVTHSRPSSLHSRPSFVTGPPSRLRPVLCHSLRSSVRASREWNELSVRHERGMDGVSDRRAVHRSFRSLLPSRSATPAPRLFARGRRTAPLLVPRRSLITSPFGTGSARWTGAPHAVRRCLRRVVDIEWRAFP